MGALLATVDSRGSAFGSPTTCSIGAPSFRRRLSTWLLFAKSSIRGHHCERAGGHQRTTEVALAFTELLLLPKSCIRGHHCEGAGGHQRTTEVSLALSEV